MQTLTWNGKLGLHAGFLLSLLFLTCELLAGFTSGLGALQVLLAAALVLSLVWFHVSMGTLLLRAGKSSARWILLSLIWLPVGPVVAYLRMLPLLERIPEPVVERKQGALRPL